MISKVEHFKRDIFLRIILKIGDKSFLIDVALGMALIVNHPSYSFLRNIELTVLRNTRILGEAINNELRLVFSGNVWELSLIFACQNAFFLLVDMMLSIFNRLHPLELELLMASLRVRENIRAPFSLFYLILLKKQSIFCKACA